MLTGNQCQDKTILELLSTDSRILHNFDQPTELLEMFSKIGQLAFIFLQ